MSHKFLSQLRLAERQNYFARRSILFDFHFARRYSDFAMHGRHRLRRWIDQYTNQRRFAATIGIHEAYLSQVLSGVRTPSLPILAAIERETGIPIQSWVPRAHSVAERRRRAKAKKAQFGAVQAHE